MNKDSKIYIAGHRGMVGAATYRALQAAGYDQLVTRTHSELDLLFRPQSRPSTRRCIRMWR